MSFILHNIGVAESYKVGGGGQTGLREWGRFPKNTYWPLLLLSLQKASAKVTATTSNMKTCSFKTLFARYFSL